VFGGIVASIVPELASLTKVPILIGAAKDPTALDSWAVYVFTENVPRLVNGTETGAPFVGVMQKGEPVIASVVMVGKTFTCTSLLVAVPQAKVEIHTT
jgi:hypothetical protein